MLSRLYAIVDAACFPDTPSMCEFVEELLAGGVQLLQYRNKSSETGVMLAQARELKRIAAGGATLIMNDRTDLTLAAGYDGVHLGQDDLSPEGARAVIGPELWMGVSTHNPAQIEQANRTSATYLAIGPVFPTASKNKPDPVVGLGGVRKARSLTKKPLVAIGGITRSNCVQVLQSGADSVAVISDLLLEPKQSAEEFLRLLR